MGVKHQEDQDPTIGVHPDRGEPSKTVQSDALKSDIGSIMAKWIRDGVVPVTGKEPRYGDFSTVGDFHTALNRVMAAQDDFYRYVPSKVRKYCDHDVGKFLELVYDPERRGELEELGLLEKQAPSEAPPAAVESAEPQPEG